MDSRSEGTARGGSRLLLAAGLGLLVAILLGLGFGLGLLAPSPPAAGPAVPGAEPATRPSLPVAEEGPLARKAVPDPGTAELDSTGSPAPVRRPASHPAWRIEGVALALESGAPLAGAAVRALEAAPSHRITEEPPILAEATTRLDGTFTLDLPAGEGLVLEARAKGRVPGRLDLAGSSTPSARIRLLLAPGGEIEGQVRDSRTGEPLPGVEVWAEVEPGGSGGEPRVLTGEQGRFRLEGLPLGRTLQLKACWPGFPTGTDLQIQSGTSGVVLVLPPVALLRIRLLLPPGVPAPRLLDVAWDRSGPTVDRRSFSPVPARTSHEWPPGCELLLPVLPGPGEIKIHHAEALMAETWPVELALDLTAALPDGTRLRGRTVLLTVREAEIHPATVLLARDFHIRGRMLDASGRPLREVEVGCPPHPSTGRTDREGRFLLTGVPREAPRLLARAPDGSAADFPLTGSDRDWLDLGDLRLAPGPGAVEGVAVDEQGRPCPGATVLLHRPEDGSWTWALQADGQGRFSQRGLPWGGWELLAYHAGTSPPLRPDWSQLLGRCTLGPAAPVAEAKLILPRR